MDFQLTEEQALLRDTARELLGRSYDAEKRNKVIETELGWSRDVWRQLAETGLLGLSFTEENGGMGAGPVETAAVLTEIGRRLAPEPLLDAVLLPGWLIEAAGSAEQCAKILPQVAEGASLLGFAHAEPGSRWPDTDLATVASHDESGWRLTGSKNPVPHGDCADQLVVSAKLPDGGTGLFLLDPAADGVARTGYRTYDGLRGAQLDFSSAPAEPLGEATDAATHIEAAVVRAQDALCAEAVGAMDEALRLTAEYLKARKQFGVPLAKFQTLTQRAADMYVSLEMARSMSTYLTMSIEDDRIDTVIASRAKLQVARSARHIGQEAVQLHGGIGITAEYPVSHYVARLTAIEQTFGGAREHVQVLSARLSDYARVEL
ncbi:acyl-CoA/acyl-ACP dehydrogenase [Aldersonia sp. NBC_00410]|uniref:acyl-CoA dehydrogenase family protein n=1 Tax=Aldersonia sp. NBC_00410 TaxID=2975954 RepID=UPI00225190E0|nr:acyl-CoA dehydrogenase family protein [Aldersonia sp. NBC_00410]MCX5043684.1 acyl-CoA/acyl-ACP dehydrogenase [Aldersonia sp. NBC_00410]